MGSFKQTLKPELFSEMTCNVKNSKIRCVAYVNSCSRHLLSQLISVWFRSMAIYFLFASYHALF